MTSYFLLILLLLFSSCGAPAVVSLPSLSASLPTVLNVAPENGSEVESAAEINVCFSEEIDAATVDRFTFLVVEDFNSSSLKSLQKEVDNGKILGLDGSYSISEDALCARFEPETELHSGKRYGIILTKDVQSAEGFSLSKMYVSSFDLLKSEDGGETIINPSIEAAGAASVEQNNVINQQYTAEQSSIALIGLVLNEIYYDAQDLDTNGELFIELKGAPGGAISGYKIIFINGDDGKITDSITLPSGASVQGDGFYVIADAASQNANQTNVAGADFITNFDPQNGPDAVQLLDNSGGLIDAVCYGEVKVKIAENGLAMCENSPALDASAGKSISRLENADDTDDNSADFIINSEPSPKSGEVTFESLPLDGGG